MSSEPTPLVNHKHVIPSVGEKAFGPSLKPKVKAQEPMTKKGKSRKISPIWKQVVVNPFGPTSEKSIKLNSLEPIDFTLAEVREFRAGGSMFSLTKLVNHTSANENQDMSSLQELEVQMREEVEKVGMETNLDPDPPTAPSMENSSQLSLDKGPQSAIKVASESIAKCILKRIYPSLHQEMMEHVDEVDCVCRDDPCDGNQMVIVNPGDDMQLE